MMKQLLVFFVLFCTLSFSTNTEKHDIAIESGSSRQLMAMKLDGWRGFFYGDSSCVSVVKNGAICGWTSVSAGVKCAWSYVKCIVPKCSKCCGKGIWKWACRPCKCSWNCSKKTCKKEFKKVGKSCKIATSGCEQAFNRLSSATKRFFQNVGSRISRIAGKIRKAASWVAQKTWGAIRWVWNQIKRLADLKKFFEIARSIGQVFRCFGKLGSSSKVKDASRQANNVRSIASSGKRGFISRVDRYIPGFKRFICCMQSTAIGRVLNKWGRSLKSFRRGYKGLKVGSFLDDPAIVVSLAAGVNNGFRPSAGTSIDFAISTAFNIGIYWTLCAGWVTDIGAGVSVVVNLFRKFSFIPGQSIAASFSAGIPGTPIGAGAGIVLPIGSSGISFGAVNVEVGRGEGVAPAAVGGFVCDTRKLVEFNLLELIGNILTANNECPSRYRLEQQTFVEAEEEEETQDIVPTTDDNRRLFKYNSKADMTRTILKAHKAKILENNDKELRDELKRRVMESNPVEEDTTQTNEENTSGQEEIRFAWQKIDPNPCGANNLEATTFEMKKNRIDKLVDRVIVAKLCSRLCQRQNPNRPESGMCSALRARACKRRLLGSRFNTVKKCCEMIDKDPEDLIFHVRKLCAVRGVVTKPSKAQFCAAARRSARDIQNNFSLVNTILDGCAANYSPRLCLLLKGTRDATQFSRVAKRLCSRRKMENTATTDQIGGAAMVGLGVAVTGFIAFGIKKLRSKSDGQILDYERVPDF